MVIQGQLCSDNFGFSLGGSQNFLESGYGFNEFGFNLSQKQQQNLCFNNNGLVSNHNNHQAISSSHSIAAQIEKQRQEIDRVIHLQNERLRLALQEQRKQEAAIILRKCESRALILLKQKDEEIAKAKKRTSELEEFMRRIEIEGQTWQRMARENEAIVASLNNTIKQIRENQFFSNVVEDAESCCDDRGEREGETGENRGHEERDNRGENSRKMVCKSCNSRNSCVVFLPCQHLCSCKSCLAFLGSCPVCGTLMKAAVEVLF
ncbi:probable BOI-related E3 ubiquitin-protein ligase 2 [Actinidia eriantha]|uniref:probable BOI-related E3 ubiquitin-protein ligase 2 n=1 Tax=Actinidia eriantha TaxID=165200 RepID=UPI00258EF3A2|nr:probable BOI-related E3 ubiquitin-protein ligase 2 [Actinidia eriantha]